MVQWGPEGTELPTSNVVGFVRGLINEGVGSTRGLDRFREAGGEIRTQRWFDLFKSETAVASRYPDTLGMDPNTVPAFHAFEPFEMGNRPGYAARVRVTIWDVEAQQFIDKWYTHVSDDPFTPAEAEQAAIEMWSGIPGGVYEAYAVGATVARVGPVVPYSGGRG